MNKHRKYIKWECKGERRLQAAHGQTNRQTDRTWGDAATYRGVKEFQNSLQVKVAAAT